MSSEIKYNCNFCHRPIVSTHTSQGLKGYCRDDDAGEFTYQLHKQMDGPHICHNCVQEIINTEHFDS